MKSTYKTRFFPFSPGIPWKIKNGKFVVPEIDGEIWQHVLSDKHFTILAHGGLIESFFSLSIAEALTKLGLVKNGLSWAGNGLFWPLIKQHGLAQPKSFPDVSEKYPVPIFLDKKNNAYINCLNNYITLKSYYKRNLKYNKDPILKQIFSNSTLNWDKVYLPNNFSDFEYKKWCLDNNFYDNQKYIVIIESGQKSSKHNIDLLGWSNRKIREFISMINRYDLKIVLVTDRPDLYYGLNIYIIDDLQLPVIISLIKKSWGILSKTIDFLLIALCISSSNVFALDNKEKHLDLNKNAEFIGANNMIFISKNLSPIEIYTLYEAL